ncbi:MAG TPA: hypothetical protein DD422_01015 [Akkermansia sp.]|nr:hypothetical protein [Akkermansia sp.]
MLKRICAFITPLPLPGQKNFLSMTKKHRSFPNRAKGSKPASPVAILKPLYREYTGKQFLCRPWIQYF